jgi:hypothetical protein
VGGVTVYGGSEDPPYDPYGGSECRRVWQGTLQMDSISLSPNYGRALFRSRHSSDGLRLI